MTEKTSGVVIMRADARCLPITGNSVDLIVTSPPYFALRSYQDGGEHYAGQVGAEATPAEFVDALIACTREWLRVLKPSGSLWVNLGDKYANDAPSGNTGIVKGVDNRQAYSRIRSDVGGVRTKSLIGIPWRYALRCIDELGLILRAEVIWSKPNGLPESVTDRVRRSHEQWFHFTMQPRYFSAVDEIREPHLTPGVVVAGRRHGGSAFTGRDGRTGTADGSRHTDGNPLGKLPGSVWTVPTEPLSVPDELGVDHFAAFPTEWPRRIIQGWSPAGVCVECGEGRRPVVEKTLDVDHSMPGQTDYRRRANTQSGGKHWDVVGSTVATITGYACGCPEPTARTRPAVVLDPFGGTGTTALVASVLGRLGVSVDLSGDYCRLARWRTTDPGERARAMRVEKPPKQVSGQCDLFEPMTEHEDEPVVTEACHVA